MHRGPRQQLATRMRATFSWALQCRSSRDGRQPSNFPISEEFANYPGKQQGPSDTMHSAPYNSIHPSTRHRRGNADAASRWPTLKPMQSRKSITSLDNVCYRASKSRVNTWLSVSWPIPGFQHAPHLRKAPSLARTGPFQSNLSRTPRTGTSRRTA